MMVSARELALQYVEAALRGSVSGEAATAEREDAIWTRAEQQLSAEDRGLFQELGRGVLREWLFLGWVVRRYAKRSPATILDLILRVSAYQLLFLDRVPAYAVFSEAKKLASQRRLSLPEGKFLHGVLKSVEKSRDELLSKRTEAIASLKNGALPDGKKPESLEWAVLNCEPGLVDALTLVEEGITKKAARTRAVGALLAMRERAALVGYRLPAKSPSAAEGRAEASPLESAIAPQAVAFTPSDAFQAELRAGTIRVQGEASQWTCLVAAKSLKARRSGGAVRVLEMAAGKGGKLLGTLVAWTFLENGDSSRVPALEWVAVDSSQAQLDLLEETTLPLIRRLWPQVTVDTRRLDWSPPVPELGRFDLVWLDAPCTGFGTLARLPQISVMRGAEAYDNATQLARVQLRLATEGVNLLAEGGEFLYTVCTLTRPETLDLVEKLKTNAGLRVKEVQALWPGLPPAPRAEGFFLALGSR